MWPGHKNPHGLGSSEQGTQVQQGVLFTGHTGRKRSGLYN